MRFLPVPARLAPARLVRARPSGAVLAVGLSCLLTPTAAPAQNLEWASPGGPPPALSGSADLDGFAGVPGTPDDPEQVPVDGGVLLLGAAGAAYAARRLRRPAGRNDPLARERLP